MRFLKTALVFAGSFLLAWIIIFTFIQEPFHHTVPARLLWHQTQSIPIYYYLVGAFSVGLAIGVAISLYYYVTLSVTLRRKDKELRDLSGRIEVVEKALNDTKQPALPPQKPVLPVPAVESDDADMDEDDELLDDDDDLLDSQAGIPEQP